jgi:hypothetical protein
MGLTYGQDLHAASALARRLDVLSGTEVEQVTPPV